jgi:hypothetical protein
MPENDAPFEVEIRCHFDNAEEAYRVLPFIRSCLQREIKVSWATRFYGLTLFKSGQLLRAGEAVHHGDIVHFLGWKGPDTGVFANIRQEMDEVITTGIADSAILKLLGGKGRVETPEAAVQELERLGHRMFMSFQGNDLTGYDDQFGVKVKLMSCPVLKWPLLVELEKSTNSQKDAARCEADLERLSNKFHLWDRLVREEPPTLLFAGPAGK